MLEFSFTLGPLHIGFRLANPELAAGGEYIELGTDTQVVDDDAYEPAEEDRIGFRAQPHQS